MFYWRKHVKMGDKFYRDEDNGTRQTPRRWRCDRTSSLMSMYITISRANSILDATMSPNPPTRARSSMRSCFISNCDLSERVFDKSVGQIVISDLPSYIPLNYAVNVSSNTLSDYVFTPFDAHTAWRDQTSATALIRLAWSNVSCNVNVRSKIGGKKMISSNEVVGALRCCSRIKLFNTMLKFILCLKNGYLKVISHYIIDNIKNSHYQYKDENKTIILSNDSYYITLLHDPLFLNVATLLTFN